MIALRNLCTTQLLFITTFLVGVRMGARHRGRGQDHEDGAHMVDLRRYLATEEVAV